MGKADFEAFLENSEVSECVGFKVLLDTKLLNLGTSLARQSIALILTTEQQQRANTLNTKN